MSVGGGWWWSFSLTGALFALCATAGAGASGLGAAFVLALATDLRPFLAVLLGTVAGLGSKMEEGGGGGSSAGSSMNGSECDKGMGCSCSVDIVDLRRGVRAFEAGPASVILRESGINEGGIPSSTTSS